MAKRIASNNNKGFRLRNGKIVEITPSPSTASATCATVSSGFGAVPQTNQVTLSWGGVFSTSYNVRYRLQGQTAWTTVSTSNLNITITGLSSSATYEWQVQAVCSNVSLIAAWSATQQFTTQAVSTGNITAGFYRNAKVVDSFGPDDFDQGQITENDLAANTNFQAAKFFCEDPNNPIWEKVTTNTGISGSRDWIVWRSKSTNCSGGPWFSRWQAYRDNCECSTISQELTPSQEAYFDAYYWFPNTTNEDPPEPDWVSNIGGKMSPSVTGVTGVGVTGGNPQTTGKHEGIFHWYGLLNSKQDRRGSTHKGGEPFTITKFEIGWSVYEADTRNAGNKYQHDYFFCESGGTVRKVFDHGIEYRFRGFTRLNTPGVRDGIYYWQVSEDGAAWEEVLDVTDADQQGNFDTPYGRAGLILFRGGSGSSWLVGNNSSYPTTVHDTFVYVRHFFFGTFHGMTAANGLSPVQDGNMFSFYPDDQTNGETITNVLWEVKDTSGVVLYSGNNAPDTISKTGNFYHGRYIWPIIDLQPAFDTVTNGEVQVCKTITTSSGTSLPFCITYQKGVYDDGTVVVQCSAPGSLQSTPSTNSVQLTWADATNATSYDVFYKELNATNFNSVSSTNNSATITGLSSGTTYEWYVISDCGSSTTSGSSAIAVFSTASQNICTTPTGLTSGSLTDSSAVLSWSNTNPSSGYDLQYRIQGTNTWLDTNINNNLNQLTGLDEGTTYEWRVRSDCGTTQSGFSNTETFTTNIAPPVLISGNFNVLLSVDDAGSPSAGDAAIFTLLNSQGNYTITYATDNSLSKDVAEQYDLVIFGPSSTSHDNKLRWANVNMVFCTHQDVNTMWVANTGTTGGGNATTLEITNNSHPVTTGLSSVVTVTSTGTNQTSISGLAQGFQKLGENVNNGNVAIAVMENGAATSEWWSLGRKGFLPFSDIGYQNLTTTGEQLVVNMMDWVASYDLSLSPNIAPYGLISHPLDNDKHLLIASRSLDHKNASFVFEIYDAVDGNLYDLVFSEVPYVEYDTGGNDLWAKVRQTFNNNDYKILVYDEVSGYNHNHGDEAEDLMNSIIDALGPQVNTNFTVEKNNTKVKSDELLEHDMLVLASTSGASHLNSEERVRIETFVANGGSVLSMHAASDAFWHSTANGGNTGVWDYYAESIVGASIQRSPNHTQNRYSGTLRTVTPTTDLEKLLLLDIPSTWALDEEYYYWENGYISPLFTESMRVDSTGSKSYDVARMMNQYYEHSGGGLMWFTALAHHSDTWDNVTNFRKTVENAFKAAWIHTHFTDARSKMDGVASSSTLVDDTGTGTTFYISATGSGSMDGSSPANAYDWPTVQASPPWNLGPSNDTYLFNRGDVYYDAQNGGTLLNISSGGTGPGNYQTFGAYGTGDKPKFVGSPSASYTSNTWSLQPDYIAGPNVWNLSVAGPNPTLFLQRGDKSIRIPKARTPYLFADGGSGSQLIDSSFPTDFPDTNSNIQVTSSEYQIHWKADLYTWEWDTVNTPYAGTGTFNFVSGSHTTGISTQFPYYIEGGTVLFEEGDQSISWVASYSNATSLFMRVPNGVDPNDYSFTAITANTGVAIQASFVYLKNLDFDGLYQEAVYIDGAGRTDIIIENTVMQNIFGAGVYNEFDGEFILSNCLLNDIAGVGVYINSSQATQISQSTLNDIGLDGGQILGVRSIPGRATNQFHSGITGFGKTVAGMENLVVSQNKVFNIGYNGIRFDGVNNLVQGNLVVASMLELSDGGGIYSFGGNATAYTTSCTVTNNTVIYTPGNLNATSKNPDRNLAEGIYLDNGNDGTNVTGNVIAFAGGWGALSNFDNIDCTWDDNTFIGSDRFGLLTFDSTAPASNNNDNNVTNNTFITWHPTHSPIIALNRTGPVGSYQAVDTSDNNLFITLFNQNPAHENVTGVGYTYTEWVSYGNRYFENLSDWQTASGLDSSSDEVLYQKNHITKDDTRNNVIFYQANFGSSAINITLEGSWELPSTTVGGSPVTFPYSLAAGDSVVMIRS